MPLIWLHDARRDLQARSRKAERLAFENWFRQSLPLLASEIRLSLNNPAVRAALQITLASAIAMVFGLMLRVSVGSGRC